MKTYINNSWQYTEKFDRQLLSSKKSDIKIKLAQVDIPHTVAETPLNYFDESVYQKVSGYRKTFKTMASWKNRRVFITFEGAAHEATVYLNGKLLGTHNCGYTAFTFEMTDFLLPAGKENVLAVKLDSRETLDVPPFGFVIDYMTYGGIYRDVYIEDKPEVFIDDVFVTTKENLCSLEISLSKELPAGTSFNFKISRWNKPGAKKSSSDKPLEFNAELESDSSLLKKSVEVKNAEFWSPENPALYTVTVSLDLKSKLASDEKTVRFGFRDIVMNDDGFFLNGKKYKIRGLDRHQSYAYCGYAVPKSVQRFDAEVLKNELALNAVRTSHYPQSQHFIDACDELGLLVFTEIPGWQHIGKSAEWRKQAVQNTKDMVLQYRNHPSVFLWGVRINESCDDDELYAATNAAAHELDFSRPTGGVRCIKKSHLLEDVYTYNDFVHSGFNKGCEDKKNVTPDMKKSYLISEYCGHMYPTKIFDDEIQRTEHAIRHARVLNDVAEKDNISGSFGWCAFDYNTHQDFGSGDRICYHGVMDMYRNPKLASAVYKSQGDAEPVLEVSTSMDVGEHPACVRGKNWIFTNADSVKMYYNDIFITEFFPKNSPFKNLAHPPLLIDDFVGNRFVEEEGLNESVSRDAKKIVNFVAMNGQVKFPKEFFAVRLGLFFKGYNADKLRKLYDKYVGNWGGAASVYKFEAVKNGKVVKTVSKGPVKKLSLEAVCSTCELKTDDSWDSSVIRLAVKDQYGNVVPYYMESVSLSASGAIELIGPAVTCFRGGYAGTFVRTTGKKGKGQLVIETGSLTRKLFFTVN
ncbi:MAG: glycoside hydrolase family 2 TIM barrel-domain containing protein [Treponema sp.]